MVSTELAVPKYNYRMHIDADMNSPSIDFSPRMAKQVPMYHIELIVQFPHHSHDLTSPSRHLTRVKLLYREM